MEKETPENNPTGEIIWGDNLNPSNSETGDAGDHKEKREFENQRALEQLASLYPSAFLKEYDEKSGELYLAVFSSKIYWDYLYNAHTLNGRTRKHKCIGVISEFAQKNLQDQSEYELVQSINKIDKVILFSRHGVLVTDRIGTSISDSHKEYDFSKTECVYNPDSDLWVNITDLSTDLLTSVCRALQLYQSIYEISGYAIQEKMSKKEIVDLINAQIKIYRRKERYDSEKRRNKS